MAPDIWSVIRDFNNHPTYIRAVVESIIEDDLSGTTVGAVRRFRLGESWTRQRLVALSDVHQYFTYESTELMRIDDYGTERELTLYRGTVRLRPTTVDGQTYVEWEASCSCQAEDAEYWEHWWAQTVPQWLDDLRDSFAA